MKKDNRRTSGLPVLLKIEGSVQNNSNWDGSTLGATRLVFGFFSGKLVEVGGVCPEEGVSFFTYEGVPWESPTSKFPSICLARSTTPSGSPAKRATCIPKDLSDAPGVT